MPLDTTTTMKEWPVASVKGLTSDSRRVRTGWLFAAIPGTRADGRDFIGEAVDRGASVVLTPSADGLDAWRERVALVEDPNPRRRLATMAAEFYGRQPHTTALVTGTNGKTSVADFTRQVWEGLGHRAASAGTLGVTASGIASVGGLTTPDPISLYRILAQLASCGVDHAVMEASSHGLEQHRLDAVVSTIGAFTSFSRDHLDYHPTVEAYLEAKLRLFDAVVRPGGYAIVNADDPVSELIEARARKRRQTVIGYGRRGLWLELVERLPEAESQILHLRVLGRTWKVRLPLVGEFQAMNALAACGIALASGAEATDVVPLIETLENVRGRMELAARHPNGAPIYVDYAHTPDALEHALGALRAHASGRVVVVFGAGGDRDPGKRPLMGAAAARIADTVIVTDDNPRTEDATRIRKQVLEGCPKALDIGDRAAAIAMAVRRLRPQDVLLIAGKGHEQGQIVGQKVLPFDDAAVARRAVAALETREDHVDG